MNDKSHEMFGDVDKFAWSGSSVLNAYYSGVSYEQLVNAFMIAGTNQQLDIAIAASEWFNNTVEEYNQGVQL